MDRDYPGRHGYFSPDYYRCFCNQDRPWSMVGCPLHQPHEQELKHLLRDGVMLLAAWCGDAGRTTDVEQEFFDSAERALGR